MTDEPPPDTTELQRRIDVLDARVSVLEAAIACQRGTWITATTPRTPEEEDATTYMHDVPPSAPR